MPADGKYIVFKRDEFENWVYKIDPVPLEDAPVPACIEDAVVIRTQDAFAGPALHAYAANIALSASLLASDGTEEHRALARKLIDIGDYFHTRALEADAQALKLPD